MSKQKITIGLLILAIAIITFGAFGSVVVTRKRFLEDFNRMNSYYKQALFLTGQSKREEASKQYDLLTTEYMRFSAKYTAYRPYAIKNDSKFGTDLINVGKIIASTKDGVYSGDLPSTHKELEAIRPIFQEMFKRNGFSMLAMALVDFHDKMEEIIAAADAKNNELVISIYPKVNESLVAIEKEDASSEIQIIRKNLDSLKQLAEEGKSDELGAKAAELKASFIKVYLVKG